MGNSGQCVCAQAQLKKRTSESTQNSNVCKKPHLIHRRKRHSHKRKLPLESLLLILVAAQRGQVGGGHKRHRGIARPTYTGEAEYNAPRMNKRRHRGKIETGDEKHQSRQRMQQAQTK